ncbi:hypothetical protein BRADI_3g34191v3 [Brachypodium distachyon]|uniref:F-box domain-containing protein n=1 Tax=Brachypodium distachyon TaxID=15368 RepID=A0A0Q3FFP3_BRADI|nr:hypothetical protein BRADI_3g34191v3 [Brachypodium distachyon]
MAESVVAGKEEEDRISPLPDDLLRYILSFLLSRQAVWTSVLARRWRNLWKSVPAVRIDEDEINTWFVNSLLLLRDRAPLHELEIISCFDDSYAPRHMEMWLRNTLDFSSCPVLEVLQIYFCEINAEKILCQSLRPLVMSECHFVWCIRTCISCPSLTDLELNDNAGLTPFLESMPSLVTASVWFDGDWADREYRYDHCFDSYYGGCDDGSCLACHIINLEGDGCVFLEGLCGATNLKLTSAPEMFICRRDFKWRHTFSKLKTLLLNEWCLVADFSGLVYFLRYSPILERLRGCLVAVLKPMCLA